MNSFILVKHGHCEADDHELLVSDPKHSINHYGLTTIGLHQAIELGKVLFSKVEEPYILSSDFLSCRETATILRDILSCPLEHCSALRERSYGNLEGLHESWRNKVIEEDNLSSSHKKFQVESNEEVAQRLHHFLDQKKKLIQKYNVIIISHQNTLKILQCLMMKVPLRCANDLPSMGDTDYIEHSLRPPVLIAAHRGDSGHLPENTLPAFHSAIDKKCDRIELDFHYTLDQRPVVIHDPDLKRVANKDLEVRMTTAMELDMVDLTMSYPNSLKIPILKEVLELAKKNSCPVLTELKTKWNTEPTNLKLIKQYEDVIELMCFDEIQLINARRQFPDLKCILLLEEIDHLQSIVSIAKKHQFYGLNLEYHLILNNPKIVNYIKAHHLKVYCWTVNTTHEALELVQKQVDLITSDYPGELLQYLRSNEIISNTHHLSQMSKKV